MDEKMRKNWFIRYYYGEHSYGRTFWYGFLALWLLLFITKWGSRALFVAAFAGHDSTLGYYLMQALDLVYPLLFGLWTAAVWHTSKCRAHTGFWKVVGRAVVIINVIVLVCGSLLHPSEWLLRIAPFCAVVWYCYKNMEKNDGEQKNNVEKKSEPAVAQTPSDTKTDEPQLERTPVSNTEEKNESKEKTDDINNSSNEEPEHEK